MEPSTTEYKYKKGDWVKVVDEGYTHRFLIGKKGVVVDMYKDSTGVTPIYNVIIEGIELDTSDSNNVTSNQRKFFTNELEIDKNAIVRNILNDL